MDSWQVTEDTNKVIDRYGDRIARALSVTPRWEDPLGCGSWGCTYPTNEEGLVVKLTFDATEGPVCYALMKTALDKNLDGLCRVESTWRLPMAAKATSYGAPEAYVILREDVQPIEGSEYDQIERLDEMTPALSAINEYKMLAEDFVWKEHDMGTTQHQLRFAAQQLNGYNEFRDLHVALLKCMDRGITLVDTHWGNLGMRKYDWGAQAPKTVRWSDGLEAPPAVLFDYGVSQPPSGVRVPNLPRMLRKNETVPVLP